MARLLLSSLSLSLSFCLRVSSSSSYQQQPIAQPIIITASLLDLVVPHLPRLDLPAYR